MEDRVTCVRCQKKMMYDDEYVQTDDSRDYCIVCAGERITELEATIAKLPMTALRGAWLDARGGNRAVLGKLHNRLAQAAARKDGA